MEPINTNGHSTASQHSFLRMVANIISYILHPVFIPLFLTLAIYKLSPISFSGIEPKQISLMVAMIVINTVLFPLLTMLLLKGLGFIQSIKLKTAKDRIIPLIATMVFYFWTYQVSKGRAYPLLLEVLFLGNFWGIVLLFLVNIFFKVSMHTAAMGGAIGITIVLMLLSPINMMLPLFAVVIIAGIVGTARLILHEHTQAEIWLGYILGLVSQLAAYLYLR